MCQTLYALRMSKGKCRYPLTYVCVMWKKLVEYLTISAVSNFGHAILILFVYI